MISIAFLIFYLILPIVTFVKIVYFLSASPALLNKSHFTAINESREVFVQPADHFDNYVGDDDDDYAENDDDDDDECKLLLKIMMT
jgi:hypothetical protein